MCFGRKLLAPTLIAGAAVAFASSAEAAKPVPVQACNRGGNPKPDLLPDEPGGYVGFNALFGNANVAPAIVGSKVVLDMDGKPIADSHGNPGFPGFDPTETTLLLR